jgi:hypothetical protein
VILELPAKRTIAQHETVFLEKRRFPHFLSKATHKQAKAAAVARKRRTAIADAHAADLAHIVFFQPLREGSRSTVTPPRDLG